MYHIIREKTNRMHEKNLSGLGKYIYRLHHDIWKIGYYSDKNIKYE